MPSAGECRSASSELRTLILGARATGCEISHWPTSLPPLSFGYERAKEG